ncbi:hypothetical protein [Streptomyces sp. NPDC126514]|uniref:hypothetical protein n=1 Tax=Streptomyces sp. NPDC126514 TaxID=3155210 RepID=UPI00332FBDB2
MEFLGYGRKIRNGMVHGQTTHAAMPPAMAAVMVTTSFTVVSELCTASRVIELGSFATEVWTTGTWG